MLNVAHFLIRSLFRCVQATLVATKHCTFRSSDPLAPLASRVRSRARLLTMLRGQRVPWRALRNAAAPIRWTCAVAPTNFVRLCSRSNGQKEPPVTVARGIDVRVGQVATATVTFTKEDVATFAELVGDHNGIHIDSEVAAASRCDCSVPPPLPHDPPESCLSTSSSPSSFLTPHPFPPAVPSSSTCTLNNCILLLLLSSPPRSYGSGPPSTAASPPRTPPFPSQSLTCSSSVECSKVRKVRCSWHALEQCIIRCDCQRASRPRNRETLDPPLLCTSLIRSGYVKTL